MSFQLLITKLEISALKKMKLEISSVAGGHYHQSLNSFLLANKIGYSRFFFSRFIRDFETKSQIDQAILLFLQLE